MKFILKTIDNKRVLELAQTDDLEAIEFEPLLPFHHYTWDNNQNIIPASPEARQKYEKKQLSEEYKALKAWLKEYDIQVIQYARHMRSNKPFNKNIYAMDYEADIKAKRITEIKNILEEMRR